VAAVAGFVLLGEALRGRAWTRCSRSPGG
jgi:hypothetical protein